MENVLQKNFLQNILLNMTTNLCETSENPRSWTVLWLLLNCSFSYSKWLHFSQFIWVDTFCPLSQEIIFVHAVIFQLWICDPKQLLFICLKFLSKFSLPLSFFHYFQKLTQVNFSLLKILQSQYPDDRHFLTRFMFIFE